MFLMVALNYPVITASILLLLLETTIETKTHTIDDEAHAWDDEDVIHLF